VSPLDQRAREASAPALHAGQIAAAGSAQPIRHGGLWCYSSRNLAQCRTRTSYCASPLRGERGWVPERSSVVIDATRLTRRALRGRTPTGIDRASLAYVEHYRNQAQALVTWLGWAFLLPRAASRRLWSLLLAQGPRSRSRIALTVLWGAIAGVCSFRRAKGHILLNTGHTGLERGRYRAVLSRYRFKPVFLIHDLIPVTHPEYCRPGERDRHAFRIRTALEHGAGLIANSHATLRELAAHAGQIRATMPTTVTAPLASSLTRAGPGARPLGEPYFVILGTIEARKNHWMLLHVWRQLIERLGAAAPKLVVIGQRGWECETAFDLLDRCKPLRGFVIEHSTCTDDDLNNYLCHSCALLYPSFAEGYGLALVEALTLGVPVIVSDLPAFREVGGDVPEYVDPLDGRRWAELVLEFARPESRLRTLQLERLSRFKQPTWSEHFAIVDGLIGQLNGSA
jgi:glycosyltransferase involved in cell wall biosynthesis